MNDSAVLAVDTGTAFDQAVQCSQRKLKLKRGNLEAEELVLKQCWLARYWGLAAKHGVYPHISHKKHALWAGFAPSPLEVVISAGQKAKALAAQHLLVISSAECEEGAAKSEDDAAANDEIAAQGEEEVSGVDSQLSMADEGLQELADLRVEEAVLLKISQNQNPTLIWLGLSREQAQDIQFKQAWLVYHWRRIQSSGAVEQDVAAERLLYWTNQSNRPSTYEDAVNVHRGLVELQTLGLEPQGQIDFTDTPLART